MTGSSLASRRAVYAGVIPAEILASLTSQEALARLVASMRRHWPAGMLLAEVADGDGVAADRAPAARGATGIGFANFGQERGPGGEPRPAAETEHEPARAELYAIYVLPYRLGGVTEIKYEMPLR